MEINSTNRLPLVAVLWLDSSAPDGWKSLDELTEGAHNLQCLSVGALLMDRPDLIAIAPHLASDPAQADGVMYIPRCAVQSITLLREDGPYVPEGDGNSGGPRGDRGKGGAA